MALSPKKLFIPRKGVKPPSLPVSTQDHDTNMRAIEQYVNNLAPGGVEQLIAGTNITLDPTDGEGVVTINASSGGGGGGVGNTFFSMQVGSESGIGSWTMPAQVAGMYLTPGDITGNGLETFQLFYTDSPASAITATQFGFSWMAYVDPGGSACLFPILQAPTFTGTTHIQVALAMSAMSITSTTDLSNLQFGQATPSSSLTWVKLTSGQVYQVQDTDLNPSVAFGSDLTFTPGSGDAGNGWVASSGFYIYIGSVVGFVDYTGAVFS